MVESQCNLTNLAQIYKRGRRKAYKREVCTVLMVRWMEIWLKDAWVMKANVQQEFDQGCWGW